MSSCKWQMNSYPTALFCWTMYSHSVKLPVEFNGTPQSPCTRVIAHANQCLLTQSSPSSLFLLEYPLVSPCFLSECTEEYCTGDKMQESLKKKKKTLVRNEYWISIECRIQFCITSHRDVKICLICKQGRPMETNESKVLSGDAGSRTCAAYSLPALSHSRSTKLPSNFFFSSFRPSVLDKSFPEGF